MTGWDIAGFKGPLGWEEEEQLRAKAKKTIDYWFEGDLVKLNETRPPAAAAIKTSDGHDYYDVIVLGGGTAGCIVAGRLAERGINPKTGDRLKVAMIEGGDDWTIRDPGIKPGYGSPIRRRYITNITDGNGTGRNDPGAALSWPSADRAARISGWSGAARFTTAGSAGFRKRRISTSTGKPPAWIGTWQNLETQSRRSGTSITSARLRIPGGARGLTSGPMRAERSDTRCIPHRALCGILLWARSLTADSMNRFDSKGNSLPWAYIGLNNGLKVIPNAEVQKIVIEKVPGGRPVATGAVYTDKAGAMHEVRAARVIVALRSRIGRRCCSTSLVMARGNCWEISCWSRTRTWAMHLTGDCDLVSSAYLEEPVTPEGREGDVFSEHGPWCATTPRPWGELTVHVRSALRSAGYQMKLRWGLCARIWLGAQGIHAKWRRSEAHHDLADSPRCDSLELAGACRTPRSSGSRWTQPRLTPR